MTSDVLEEDLASGPPAGSARQGRALPPLPGEPAGTTVGEQLTAIAIRAAEAVRAVAHDIGGGRHCTDIDYGGSPVSGTTTAIGCTQPASDVGLPERGDGGGASRGPGEGAGQADHLAHAGGGRLGEGPG